MHRRRLAPPRPEDGAVGSQSVRIDVFTIFPDLVDGFFTQGLLGKARTTGLLDLRGPRLALAHDRSAPSVDDSPFGGGAGMVLMPEPVFAAVEAIDPPRPLYLLGPAGARSIRPWRERWRRATASRCCAVATRASTIGSASILCDGELSMGDYVLGGGEVAACW